MNEIKIKGFLISSDVEAALVEPDAKDIPQIVPPAYLIHMQGMKVLGFRGKEEEGHPIFLKKDGITWYQDGALAETDFPPVKTAKELYKYFNNSIETLTNFMERVYGLEVWTEAVGRFNAEKYIEMGEDEVAAACVAGCSPDIDALKDNPEGEVRDLTSWKYRGIGGHVHISISKEYGEDILHTCWKPIVRLLAITAGNMGIATSSNPDLERLRKEQFGGPAKCRLPIYPNKSKGLEYRSLSAAWLNTEETTQLVVNAVKLALFLFLEQPQEVDSILKTYLAQSVTAIETVNVKLSTKILKDLGLL